MEVEGWGMEKGVIQEIGDSVYFILGEPQTARGTWPARVGKARRQRTGGAGHRVLRHTGVEVFHHVSHTGERAVMEKEPSALERAHRRWSALYTAASTPAHTTPPTS